MHACSSTKCMHANTHTHTHTHTHSLNHALAHSLLIHAFLTIFSCHLLCACVGAHRHGRSMQVTKAARLLSLISTVLLLESPRMRNNHTRWSNERNHPDLDQRVYVSKWQYRLKKEIMKTQLATHGSMWISSWTRPNRQMILGSLNLIKRYKWIFPVSCSTHRTAEEGSHERVANLGGLHG